MLVEPDIVAKDVAQLAASFLIVGVQRQGLPVVLFRRP